MCSSDLELFGDDCEYNYGFQLDVQTGEKRSVRLYFLDFENWTVNVPDIIEGAKSGAPNKIYAERADKVIAGKAVGDKLNLADYLGGIIPPTFLNMLDLNVEVAAIVQSPLTFSVDGEPSDYNEIDEIPETTDATKDMDVLEQIFYIPATLVKNMLPHNALYVAIGDRGKFSCFSSSYNSFINDKREAISDDSIKIITLKENFSFNSLSAYRDKVEGIGYILMVAFLLVTALVVLSTMTRLIDEERPQIACLKTLGYSPAGIISKYLLFALMATGIGGGGAYFVGLGLAYLLYSVFNYSFDMPPMSGNVAVVFYIIIFTLIVLDRKSVV